MAGQRVNDGRWDRQGRFWCGTMAPDQRDGAAAGRLYRYAAETLSAPVVTDLVTQNGLAWSPDERTMHLSNAGTAPADPLDETTLAGWERNQAILATGYSSSAARPSA